MVKILFLEDGVRRVTGPHAISLHTHIYIGFDSANISEIYVCQWSFKYLFHMLTRFDKHLAFKQFRLK